MSVAFRRWKSGDLEEIRCVVLETWLAAYLSFIPEDDLRSYHDEFYSQEKLTELMQNPQANGFVATENDTVVGFVRTDFAADEQRYYVSSLYVLPKYQARGIGKRLMQLAAEEARSHGLDRVWVGVMVENTAGLGWYKRLGYQITEEKPFTMGKTTVQHYIGYVLLESIEG
jgi:ribosomal protein S18 acetylase RimI-like enzyme